MAERAKPWTQEDEDAALARMDQARDAFSKMVDESTPDQVAGIVKVLQFHDQWATKTSHRRLGKFYREMAQILGGAS